MPITGVHIVGILNITTDSFSDGGRYRDADAAIAHAQQLIADGADIIDIGPASSHPDSKPISSEEEIRRLDPVLDALEGSDAIISIDSFRSSTQRYCAGRNVAYLNDIQGFPDATINIALAASNCTFIVMHSIQRSGRATRVATDAQQVIDGMFRFFDRRLPELEGAGIDRRRCILDPGLGFFLGDTPEPSLLALQELPRLKQTFDLPVLISASRKSFIGALTGRPIEERGAGTLATELWAAEHGADYIRTHDVRALADGLRVRAGLAKI